MKDKVLDGCIAGNSGAVTGYAAYGCQEMLAMGIGGKVRYIAVALPALCRLTGYRSAAVCPSGYCLGRKHRNKGRVSGRAVAMAVHL